MALILSGVLVVVSGVGYAASVLFFKPPVPQPKATTSPQPAVSASERSKLGDLATGNSQLVVTTLTADDAQVKALLAQALQVSGNGTIQGNLTVNGNGTFGGNIAAANFTGNGSGVTGVNAALLNGQPGSYYTNLASGVNALTANAALRNGNNTFTAANDFAAGITTASITDTGALTVDGATNLAGATTISSLILSTPLTVPNGGTGLTSVPVASVLYGQGGPTLGVATPGAAGLCLLSGASDVQWGSCSGAAAGVAALDGLTGVLTLANSSGAGSTVTINDASTAQKGISSFNATDFSVAAGAVDTIQGIAVTSAPTFAGLTLTSALTVGNGGTGAASLTANGVIIGNGAGALTSVTAGGAGQCLVSTAGAPAFSPCPGSGGVSSVDTLSGALTVNNSTGSGTAITINDASTAQKGIAQFNSTNFTASAGAINTIQDIATSSAPTFGQLSLSSSQATNPMLSVNNTNAGASGNLIDLKLAGTSKFSVGPAGDGIFAGTLSVGTINGQTISNAAAFTGTLGVTGVATFSGGATVVGTLTANTISPSAAMTVGATGQALTLQGNASTQLTATGGGFTTAIGFTGSPTGAVTYNFDRTATAGTYTVCSTAGNCAGVGGGVTTAGGTTNKLAKFTAAQGIGNSSITDTGTSITATPTSDSASVFQVQNAAGRSLFNVDTSGSKITLGNITSTAGQGVIGTLVLADGTNDNFGATFRPATLTNDRIITVPNAAGTIAISATGPITLDAAGNITCSTCLTSGGGGGSAGVSSVDTLTGALTIANTTGSSTTVTINDASTAQKGIAQFNSTNFTASAGAINTIQDIATSSAPTFGQLTLSSSQATNPMLLVNNTNGAGSGNLIDLQLSGSSKFSVAPSGAVSSGQINGQTISSSANFTGSLTVGTTLTANTLSPTSSLTVGATGQAFTLQGNASSTITATGGGFTTTLGFSGSPTAAVTYNLDRTAAAGSYTLCSSAGNCAGVGGGVTTAGGTTGTLPVFTAAQGIGDSLVSQSGSTVTAAGNLSLTSGHTFQINGTQISSANLSNDSNLAKLSATQTFTAANIFQDSANSATAFQVRNNSSNSVLTIDTSGNLAALGVAGTLAGKLQFANASNAHTTTLQASSSAGQDQTITIPVSSATTDTVCLVTLANCSGSGISGSGTTGTIAEFSGASALTNSPLTDSGGNLTASGNLTLQGGSLTVGVPGSTAGSVALANATSSRTVILQGLNPSGSGNATVQFPTIAGGSTDTVCLVTLANCAGAGAVTSVDGHSGALTLTNSTGAGGTITLDKAKADGSTLGVATFNASNFTDNGAGVINTIQNIATSSSPTFAAVNTNAITPSAALTVGATGQSFTLQGSNASTITATGGGFVTTLGFTGSPSGAVTYNFDRAATAGAYAVCTSAGNCLGGGGGGANTALSNLSGVAINTALLPGAAGTINLGSGTLPFGHLFVAGASGTPGTNNFDITGTSTGGTRTITLPDAGGTVCLQTSAACGFESTTGTDFIQNQNASAQTANFNITGTGTATGYILANGASRTINEQTASAGAGNNLTIQAGTGAAGANAGGNLVLQGGASTGGATGGGVIVKPQTDTTSAFAVQNAGGTPLLAVDTSGNIVNVGATGSTALASTINIATTSDATHLQGVNIGSSGDTSNTVAIEAGTGGSAIQIGNGATAHGIQIGTGAAAQTVALGSTNTTSATTISSGSGNINLKPGTGSVIIGNGSATPTLSFDNNNTAGLINFSSASSGVGNSLTVTGQTGAAASNGGTVLVQGGTAGTTGTGGAATLQGGAAAATAGSVGGVAAVKGAAGTSTGTGAAGGAVQVTGGNAGGSGANAGGAISLTAGSSTGAGTGGNVSLDAGSGTAIGSILIGGTNDAAITLGKSTGAKTITVGQSTAANTINIGNGAISSGTQTINIGTGSTSTGADSVTIGSSNATSATSIQGGSGGLSLLTGGSSSTSGSIFIQTGSSLASSGGGNVLIDTGKSVAIGGGTLGENDTFESGVGTWVTWFPGGAGGESVATTTAQAHGATHSLGVTTGGGSWGVQTTGSGQIATPGQSYTLSLWLRDSAHTQNIDTEVGWGGTGITSNLPTVSINSSGWTQVTGTVVAPVGATNLVIFVSNQGDNDPTVYIDDVTVTGSQGAPLLLIGANNADTVTLGNANESGATTIQGGSGGITLATASDTVLTASSANNRLTVGNATASSGSNTTLFVLDSATTANAPTGVNGGMFYDTTLGAFRCYQGGAWTNCIGSGSSLTMQNVYDNSSSPATVTTSAGAKTILFKAGASNDSTALFQVQSAGSVALLTVDSTNERVYVGPTAGDTTGALLVLGNKTNTGDPAGVNGAMYYNSAMHMYRCYRGVDSTAGDGAWEQCGINPIDRGFELSEEFMGSFAQTSTPVGNTGLGSNGNGTVNWTYSNGTADRPGIFNIATGGTISNGWSVMMGGSGNPGSNTPNSMTLAAGNVLKTAVQPGATVTNEILRVGLANEAGTNSQPTAGAWWEAVASTNANWRYCYYDGSTQQCTASSIAVANSWETLEIRINATGAGTSSIDFFITDSGTTTKYSVTSATLATGTAVAPEFACYTSTSSGRSCSIDYMQVRGYASGIR